MTTNQVKIELFVAMNEDGGWIVTSDESEALSNLAENESGYMARVVKVTIKMSPPVMSEVAITIADEAGHTTELMTVPADQPCEDQR